MNEDKEKMLKLTTDQIESKFGKGSIMKYGDADHPLSIDAIPTGALPLDAALGIGGAGATAYDRYWTAKNKLDGVK